MVRLKRCCRRWPVEFGQLRAARSCGPLPAFPLSLQLLVRVRASRPPLKAALRSEALTLQHAAAARPEAPVPAAPAVATALGRIPSELSPPGCSGLGSQRLCDRAGDRAQSAYGGGVDESVSPASVLPANLWECRRLALVPRATARCPAARRLDPPIDRAGLGRHMMRLARRVLRPPALAAGGRSLRSDRVYSSNSIA